MGNTMKQKCLSMEIKKQRLRALSLWFISAIVMLSANIGFAQQFINGKLKLKLKENNVFGGVYRDYLVYLRAGKEYNELFENYSGTNPKDYNDLFINFSTPGFDTLKHTSCADYFYFVLNRVFNRYGSCKIIVPDSSNYIPILLNGDTLQDFGFSLKLNQPLLKDSSYQLTFLVFYDPYYKQKLWDKNQYPQENFKIKITQSHNPNYEGDEIAVIGRQDIYEVDTSIINKHVCGYIRIGLDSANHFYYRVKKKVKGANDGLYITVKAKLIITDTISKYFRYDYKPSDKRSHWGDLNRGLFGTLFELRCPFNVIRNGSLCDKKKKLVLSSDNIHVSDKYKWSNGDTSSTITVTKPGKYWLTKDRNGCMWTDTIEIDSIENNISATKYYSKCKDSTISIGTDLSIGQKNIMWNNGDTNTFIKVNNIGIYIRKSIIDICRQTDTFKVKEYPRHKSIEEFNYTLCINDYVMLNGLVNDIEWYINNLLISSQKQLKLHVVKADTVILKSYNKCWQYDTVYIKTKVCDIKENEYIFIPNAFTPNNDGLNDEYKIAGKNIDKFEMSIYNSWGELVYHTNNTSNGWDGTYKGKEAQIGVYTVVLTIKTNNNKQTQNKSINSIIHLIR